MGGSGAPPGPLDARAQQCVIRSVVGREDNSLVETRENYGGGTSTRVIPMYTTAFLLTNKCAYPIKLGARMYDGLFQWGIANVTMDSQERIRFTCAEQNVSDRIKYICHQERDYSDSAINFR